LRQSAAEDFCYHKTFDAAEPFDVIFFSYTLSMIPDWRNAVAAALTNLKPRGHLFVLDFGDGAELPAWFRTSLFSWLRLFGVHHQPEVFEYLRYLESDGNGQFSMAEIGGRYSFLAHLQKR
jgi:S-adenosylmethionine-diacylgycerolhomoserine-N-methlytransferase